MNAADITFGIEIETTLPVTLNYPVGAYHVGVQAQGLPEGWLAMRDGSIRTSRGRIGCEFVSPVLKGAEGLRQVVAVVKQLREMGAMVNSSTGLHVHVGFDRNNREALERLVTLTANFEKAIYASTGTKSRETGSYCRPIASQGNAQTALLNGRGDRYRVLNLTNLLSGNKPTVEFRAFAGTLNEAKIVGYVAMCLGLVEKSYKAARVTNWTAKPVAPTSPIHRSGEGQTAVTRLLYSLGWTKGRTDHVFGNLFEQGIPALRTIKRTLIKLARKYDSQ